MPDASNHAAARADAHDCNDCPLAGSETARFERTVDAETIEYSRRHFVSMATLSVIGMTLAACGTGELTAEEKLLAAAQNPTPTPPATTPPAAAAPPATTPPATTPPPPTPPATTPPATTPPATTPPPTTPPPTTPPPTTPPPATPPPTTPPPATPPPPTPPPPTPPPPTPPPTPPANPPVGANQVGVTIASYPALAVVGGVAKVNANPPVAMARTASGFVAYSLRCPHQGTTVNIVGTTSWKCPNHDATFDANGTWTGGQLTTALVARTVTPNYNNTFVVVNLT